MLAYKPKFKNLLKNFYFMADTYKIKPKNTINVLGIWLCSDLKMDAQIGKLAASRHDRIQEISQLAPFIDYKTGLSFVK